MYMDLLKLGLLILIVYYILHDAYVYVIGFILLSLLIQLFSKNPLWYLLLPIIFIHLCFYYFHASVEGFHRPRRRRRRKRRRRRRKKRQKGNRSRLLEMLAQCNNMANSYRIGLDACNDQKDLYLERLSILNNIASDGVTLTELQ